MFRHRSWLIQERAGRPDFSDSAYQRAPQAFGTCYAATDPERAVGIGESVRTAPMEHTQEMKLTLPGHLILQTGSGARLDKHKQIS